MNQPGSKYFKGRVIHDERVLRFFVWDGVRNYENAPPLQTIALVEKTTGLQLHVKVDEDAVEDIHQIIAGPCRDCPEVGSLVVWTRDHRTYRLIVQRLAQECIRMM